jgi:hypothetical protein
MLQFALSSLFWKNQNYKYTRITWISIDLKSLINFNIQKTGKIPRAIDQEIGVFVILRCFHEMFVIVKRYRRVALKFNLIKLSFCSCHIGIFLWQYQFIVCPSFTAFHILSIPFLYNSIILSVNYSISPFLYLGMT